MTCFYVGKGTGRRHKTFSRNTHHDRIAKKYGYKTIIIHDNLSEKEALKLEKQRIFYYVFELKYGINIDGYRKYEDNKFLTNFTFGGEGTIGHKHTEKWKKEHSKRMSGENNPMYGIDVFHQLSTEDQNRLKKLHSGLSSGKNNPMYGISPKQRMSAEVYQEWLHKMKARDFRGENNPNFGNTTLHDKLKDNPQLRIKYYSRPKEKNGRSRSIIVFDKANKYVDEFNYIGKCAIWLKKQLMLSSKVDSIRIGIINSIKKNKTYLGYTFKYKE